MWNYLRQFADTSSAVNTVREGVLPIIQDIAQIAGLVSILLIIYAGYMYMASRGKPDRMEDAKSLVKKVIIGIVIVFAALSLTSILVTAYGPPNSTGSTVMPNLQSIEPKSESNGWQEMVINAITGALLNVINGAATPFLGALGFFTQSTPVMSSNPSVFNFWKAMVLICNVLFALVVALLGFHVISASALGFDEIEFKHLLPRILLTFALINSSIFLIDGIITISNLLVGAVGQISGATSVWETLTSVVEKTSGLGLAALLIMLLFMLFSVVLLVYYIMRLVTLYLGAVLSPLIALLWLIPGFRDFAETAFKTYLTTIFVLFVHVTILQLAASLFAGMATASGDNAVPDTLMAMVTGIATICTLLKVQGTMMQFSYVSMGARNTKKLVGQFASGISGVTGKIGQVIKSGQEKTQTTQKNRALASVESNAIRRGSPQSISYQNKKGTAEVTHTVRPIKTGTTYEAPKVTVTRIPQSSGKDKTS